jgi:hypothetical protein
VILPPLVFPGVAQINLAETNTLAFCHKIHDEGEKFYDTDTSKDALHGEALNNHRQCYL